MLFRNVTICKAIALSVPVVFLIVGARVTVAVSEEKKQVDITDLEKLQGTWAITEETYGGEALLYDNPRIIINHNTYSYLCNMKSAGIYKLGTLNANSIIDLFYGDGPLRGHRREGIYKIDQKRLTLCYRFNDRPASFASNADVPTFLETWERSGGGEQSKSVEGSWILVGRTVAGRLLASNEISGISMTLDRGDYKEIRKYEENGVVKIDETSTPKMIDFIIDSDNPRKPILLLGIYQLDDDVFKECHSSIGKPRPTHFLSKPGNGLTLRVSSRMKTQGVANQEASQNDNLKSKVVRERSSVTLAAPEMSPVRWLNRRVIIKTGTVLKVGDRVVGEEKPGSPALLRARDELGAYVVKDVRGSWLWLVNELGGTSGWVKVEQVVPIEKAIYYFTEALRVKPSSELYLRRGWIWGQFGESEKEVADFSEAIRLDPKSEIAYVNRGIAYRRKREYDKAIADYTEAIRIDPRFVLAYEHRGQTWYDLKRYDQAINDFTKLIEIDRNYSEAYVVRGDAYMSRNDRDRAFADYGQAIRIDPGCLLAYYHRAQAWCDLKRFDEAIADYGELIRLTPNNAGPYRLRGDIYARKRRYAEAIADFNDAIRLDPKSAGAYCDRARVSYRSGGHDQAIADYNEAIRLGFRSPFVYQERGWVWVAKRDYGKAITDFDEAIRLDPKVGMLYCDRGLASDAKGDHEKAMSDFAESIRLDPANAKAWSARGRAWLERKDYDKAIGDLNEAIRLDPKKWTAYFDRSLAWEGKGDEERATRDRDDAVRLQLSRP